jgi:type IV pilus assembly PilX-like protein
MKRFADSIRSPLNNENGSVIIAAIFILVVLTILGIAASNTSTLELQIASNDQFMKMAFYNADSALYGTSKLISHAINRSDAVAAGAGNDAPGVQYLSTAGDFYRQIAGFDVYDDSMDVDFETGGIDSQADARRDRQQQMAGGGAEFATGSEGVGPSAIAIFYDVNSSGFSNRQTTSNLTAAYRKMVGIPGGL